jgi:CheY-like chemotaxis protein/anti-sigma regulatory factor (Ser/Thr protein kinase)
MLNIINEIIDISKIESGQMTISISDVNINECLEECFGFFRPEAERKNIELKVTKTLQKKEALVKTDFDKLNGVLTNLIKNAIKYTNSGSIEMGYSLRKPKTEIEFYVKDTGIGIPVNRQIAIFDRFIQADIEDKMAQQGAGLGLAISRAYVEMLEGRLWVESEVNVGSTFYFTIPYKNDSMNEAETTIPVQEETNRQVSGFEKITVLIVEDDESVSVYLKALLNDICKEIHHAKTGFDAVEMCLTNENIDVVLMDIRMPGMNGYQATKKIREYNKDIIVIAQTAYALQGDREKALEAGCNDYIAKPFGKDKLLETISRNFKYECS